MIRIFCLLLALLPLGGCLISDYDIAEKIPTVRFIEDGHYKLEMFKKEDTYSVRYNGSSYDVTKEDGPGKLQFRFFDFGDPDLLLLGVRTPSKQAFAYAYASRNARKGLIYVLPNVPPEFASRFESFQVKNARADTLPILRSPTYRAALVAEGLFERIDPPSRPDAAPQLSAAPFSDRPFCTGNTNRYALVVGNQSYEGALQALTNPRADATALTKVLCDNGFTAFRYDDLKIAEFDRAIARFRTAASNAETTFVYYSGHGFAMDGKNWLVPVDAGLDCDSLGSNADPASLQRRLVDLSGGLLASLPKSSNQIVVMDACRTEPVRSCFKGGASPTMIRGLSPPGTGRLIVYASQDGKPALDGVAGSVNSPLMTAMLRKFGATPGTNWLSSMAEVSRDVARMTHNDQIPNLDLSLPPEGCLAPACNP